MIISIKKDTKVLQILDRNVQGIIILMEKVILVIF